MEKSLAKVGKTEQHGLLIMSKNFMLAKLTLRYILEHQERGAPDRWISKLSIQGGRLS